MILPFLLMILHFSQIFFTDGLTFIVLQFLSYGFYELPNGCRRQLFLFCSPSDSALIEIVYRYLNSDLISRQNSDIVHTKLSRYVSRYYVLVGKLYLEGRVGQRLNYRTFKFDYIILTQNNPSFLKNICFFVLKTLLYLCEYQNSVRGKRYRVFVMR